MLFRTITMECCRNAAPAPARRSRLSQTAFRGVARPNRPDAGFLPHASRPVRAGQADLADRDRGGRLRRKPLGRDFSRYVQISRSARTIGKGRRSGRDAQHARGQRLRPARREDADAATKLLGRAVVAAADGNDCARVRRTRSRPAFTSMRIANAASPAASACWSSTPTAKSTRTLRLAASRSATPWMRQA